MPTFSGGDSSGTVDFSIQSNPLILCFWKLDETTGTIAKDSVGSNTGTYVNSPTQGIFSYISQTGVLLNGTSQYISTSQTLNLNPVTIEAYVLISGNPSSNMSIAGFSNGFNNSTYDRDLYIDSTGKIGWNVAFFDDVLGPLKSINTLSLNRWHQIIGTFDGSVDRIYIDGKFESSRQISNSLNNYNTASFFMGKVGSSYGYFNGKLDSVALYSGAISLNDVQNHYTYYQSSGLLRVSQEAIEVARSSTTNLLRVTQYPVEVGRASQNNILRITQFPIEVGRASQNNLLRVSQQVVEVLYTGTSQTILVRRNINNRTGGRSPK